jgi:response regulator RpfG family c-di-GMP phosphodiesterase
MGAMTEKILLVDDEANVLLGYERLLHNQFKTDTAVGGLKALKAIQASGPYAVVLSDMRMPEMDGVELFTRVKSVAPDTVRIMLTGYADVKTALSAVNEGNVFRFLTKPCSNEILAGALKAGVTQYRLVTSERELLEKTLTGSLTALTEVLSMASPAAFSRAMRLRRYMGHIISKLSMATRWKFEMAAMLSQLGCVTMVPETIDAVYAGKELSPKEQALYDTHPKIAGDLLKNIPRMESVAWMIAHQNLPVTVEGDIGDREMAEMRLGAELLQVTLAFDALVRRGASRSEAASKITRMHRDLDSRIPMALVEVEPEDHEKEVRTCRIEDVSPGMIIDKEVRTETGLLIMGRNQEVTPFMILKLKNYYEKGLIVGDIVISVPHTPSPPEKK